MKHIQYIDGYVDTVRDILLNPLVISMSGYNHHGKISTHFHSVFVSFTVYKYCIKQKMEQSLIQDITQAALLHDFYLYDWPTQKHYQNHMFYHPKESVRNIDRSGIINLTAMQRDMVLNHMFPAGKIPNSKGGWILTTVDKYCATRELVEGEKCFSDIYKQILREI